MKNSITLIIALIAIQIYAQDIEIEAFATGLSNPVSIKHAGDDRLFVVERRGTIQILDENGNLNATPFLDIDPLTIGGGESGLLGLAFHPNYSANSYFYVNYTNNSGDTVVSRFTANSPTSDTADPSSELILMTIDQPFGNHNGGDLAFGPNDGYLYIATGDGGSGGDPGDRAQDLSTPLGKLLRIDVDNTSDGNNYAIPADNPLFGSTSLVQEIWSYGLRNPWRFSFDRDTGEVWIADVGQNEIEEINMVSGTSPAINYGWRCYEGNSSYNLSDCPDPSTLQFPVAEYTHSSSGPSKCSITGGYRYRGTAQPTLSGLYFFADYCSSEIGILEFDGTNWNMSFTEQYTGNNWSGFGEDINGEIYIAGLSSGDIYKIIDAELSVSEASLSDIKIYPNPVNDVLIIDNSIASINIKTIHVFDLHGKRISSINNPTENMTSISTKSMLSGFYLVEVTTTDGRKQTTKLIKN
ncbi:PQQ-dependent sugar dehydrogenase [Lacinutrix iliipiscaria]|uniref:PQQ-dependent sugar dehydrogenase n=1 Tax=Lacinutrix iliipiscaria TaxID=1230532 RepID=A0ABW5WME4_9FLAO